MAAFGAFNNLLRWGNRGGPARQLPGKLMKGTIKGGGGSVDLASSLDGGSRLGTLGSWAWNNLKMDAKGGGWDVAQRAGMTALKGSVVGGLAGGSVSALQGGSFWDGAKSGAWDGATLAAGYSTLHRATGAMGSRFGPLAKKSGREGMVSAGRRMWDATSTDAAISNQARQLLNQKQRAGVTNRIMNAHR